jgi:hypothetical protein
MRGAAGLAAAVAVVSTLSALERVGVVPLHALAATPRAVADGRVWLLVTNALVADNPVVASLLALVLLGTAALVLCGPRLALTAGAIGHVGSTVVVYLSFAIARAVVPGTFESLLEHPDFGVSAVLAAWLGAGSTVVWRAHPTRSARTGVVATCLAAAAIGWTLDTDRTALDADHVVAFAIGIALAAPVWSRAVAAVRARIAALATRATA